MNFEQWLAANNYDATALSEGQRKHLLAAFHAETAPPAQPAATLPASGGTPPAPTQTLDDIVVAARREQERVSACTDLAAVAIQEKPGLLAEIEAISRQAIEGKWEPSKLELALHRLRGNGSPMVLTGRGRPQVTAEVVEAAVCMNGNLSNLESQFNERTLEAAHSNFRHGLGLMDMVAMCARANGYRGHGSKGDLSAMLRAAFREDNGDPYNLRAEGPSTLSLGGATGLLANIANKYLRVAFLNVEQAWRPITAIRSVSDFKTITSFSLTGDNTYEQVAPGGIIKHGSLGQTSYTNSANTYAKMLGLDRRDLINDDLGALTGAGRRLGRGGALKLNDVFWTAFLNDSTFFPTNGSNNNYHADATTSLLTLAGLDYANTGFRTQTDPDGKLLASMPKILLVPVNLEATAKNLIHGTITGAAQSTPSVTTLNVWIGMFDIVASAYLSSSAITGYSTTAWYLLADPQDIPVIETCFLNGVEMPTVETAELDFDRLGISLRGFHDFGVSLQEYRGGYKQKGAA